MLDRPSFAQGMVESSAIETPPALEPKDVPSATPMDTADPDALKAASTDATVGGEYPFDYPFGNE